MLKHNFDAYQYMLNLKTKIPDRKRKKEKKKKSLP